MATAPASSLVSLSADGLLKVGQLADLTNKTVRAIRFYEELDLLEPAARTAGGFRLYDQSALTRIHWIDRLQEMGFSLPETRDFLAQLQGQDSAPAAMDHLRAFYSRKLIETRDALRRLQALEHELQESLSFLHGRTPCSPDTPRGACRACGQPRSSPTPPALVAAVNGPR